MTLGKEKEASVEIALSGILTCHYRPVKVTREPLFLHDQTNNNGQDVDVDDNVDFGELFVVKFWHPLSSNISV